jgi:hypothetical protein
MEKITSFSKRCEILADLWLNYKNDEQFQDFINYNDLALPFAYAVANNILDISVETQIEYFIDEAWRLLLEGLGLEDFGFDDLDGLLGLAE